MGSVGRGSRPSPQCTARYGQRQPATPTIASDTDTEKPAKVGTCARDRRALQQLALNVIF